MPSSIYKQISNPRQTYTDGYGIQREVYEPKAITIGRKIYNGLFGEPTFNGVKPLMGYAPLPNIPETGPFAGIEYLTKDHFGIGATYNSGLQQLETEREAARVWKNAVKAKEIVNKSEAPVISKWSKFLQRSTQEQDDLVKFWNGERFKSLQSLKNNPKEFTKFKNWINKHQSGGILNKVAFTPYLTSSLQNEEDIVSLPELTQSIIGGDIAYIPYINPTKEQQEEMKIIEEAPQPYIRKYNLSESASEPVQKEDTATEETQETIENTPTVDLSDKDMQVLTTDGTEDEKQVATIKYLSKQLDITPEQAAGVVGIFTHESHFKLNAENKYEKEGKNSNVKAEDYGIGINQWTFGRHHDYVRWIKEHGNNSLKTQLDFAIDEIKTKFPDFLNNLRNAENVQDATAYTWMQYTGAQYKNFTKEYMYSTLIPKKEAASAAWLQRNFGKVGDQGKLAKRVRYANEALQKYLDSIK